MLSWPIEKYLAVVRRSGGFVSQAHPFREASYISSIRVFPEQVDAVEVCNASHTDPKFDRLALELARKYSLYRTSGSDTHYTGRMYGGGMEFDHEIFSIGEFIEAVKKNGTTGPAGEAVKSEQSDQAAVRK
jgi:predicted metal-dependent phosphoesterase TrpH